MINQEKVINLEEFLQREQEQAEQVEDDVEVSVDALVRHGEYMRLRKNKEYKAMTPKVKITTAVKAVDNSIKNSEQMFGRILAQDPEGADIILQNDLKPLRELQKILVKRFKGQVDPKERGQQKIEEILELRSAAKSKPHDSQPQSLRKAA